MHVVQSVELFCYEIMEVMSQSLSSVVVVNNIE